MILLIAQIEKYGVYGELNNKWALLTGILQMMDFDLNVKQISNDEIFLKLQKQDKTLEQQSKEIQKQTNYYLEKIIKQNDEILKKFDNLKEKTYN
jgi:hypothetical protein